MADSIVDELIADGIAAFDKQDFRAARKLFSQAHLRAPKDPRAGFWLGAAQYHMGNVGEAREHLEGLVGVEPPPLPERPAAVHEYLCRCLLSSDTQRAIEVGEDGLEIDPDDPRLRLVTGNAYLRLERYEEALRHYDVAWQAEGGRDGTPAFRTWPGQVPFARSSVFAAQKKWKEALEAVDDALARDPDNAAYHNRRGVILYDGMGDAEAAAGAARRAAELDPGTMTSGGDGVYHYNLAVYLKALERWGEALDAVDRAIAVSPRREYKALREQLAENVGVGAGAGAAGAGAAGGAAADSAARPRLDFSKVGGMTQLKEQVRRIVEVIHSRRDEARRYGIVRNGILLYGPPGCGKSFFAEAIAGEFDLSFLRVGLGSAITKFVGGSAERIEAVFAEAKSQLPCLLFFDEFDAIAARRDDSPTQHEQQMVNALLQQIERHRDVPGLVLVAATNRLRTLDPAAIREGRFDYKVQIYRPDFDARREILQVVLQDRPHDPAVDVTGLAQKMDGFSAAQIRAVVDAAAMAAMDADAPINDGHLEAALEERIEARRYAGPRLEWDDVILSDPVKRKLQFIERFIENPELVEQLGVDPPTGALLHGPPGTGKTTIARVLASQTDASFFAVNASDVFSKWFGESEQRVKELFEQARDNVPAIIFIDEIDSILGSRGEAGSGGTRAANAVVNTFLAEMDGIAETQRIFIVGATNRPDLVDDAVLRPGRLSEVVEVGLPDREARVALLRLFSRRMKLGAHVDLEAIADDTEGASGADLQGLCSTAGRNALLRELDAGSGERAAGRDLSGAAVTAEDFGRAMEELFPERAWRGSMKSIGFQSE